MNATELPPPCHIGFSSLVFDGRTVVVRETTLTSVTIPLRNIASVETRKSWAGPLTVIFHTVDGAVVWKAGRKKQREHTLAIVAAITAAMTA